MKKYPSPRPYPQSMTKLTLNQPLRRYAFCLCFSISAMNTYWEMGTYLGQGGGVPTFGYPSPHPDPVGKERGRGYLPWGTPHPDLVGEGVPTLDGGEVPTLGHPLS